MMKIPYLRIEQHLSRIGIETISAKQQISQPPAEVKMKQIPAKLEIDRTSSYLDIDQKEAFAEIGLKDIFTLTREAAELGREAALSGTRRRAEEGSRLAAIEKEPNAIPNIAYENTNQIKEFGYGWIPDFFSVKFSFQPAKLKYNWQIGGTEIEVKTHRPQYTYESGKVRVYVAEPNSLKIDLIT